jgi:hypothetical protein
MPAASVERLVTHLSEGGLRYNDAVITQIRKKEGASCRPVGVKAVVVQPASAAESFLVDPAASAAVGHQLYLDEHARVNQPGYLDHRGRRPSGAERFAVGAADLV